MNKAVGWSQLTPAKLKTYIGQEILVNGCYRGVVGRVSDSMGVVRLLNKGGHKSIAMREINLIQVVKPRINVIRCNKQRVGVVLAQFSLDDLKGLKTWYMKGNRRNLTHATVYNYKPAPIKLGKCIKDIHIASSKGRGKQIGIRKGL